MSFPNKRKSQKMAERKKKKNTNSKNLLSSRPRYLKLKICLDIFFPINYCASTHIPNVTCTKKDKFLAMLRLERKSLTRPPI